MIATRIVTLAGDPEHEALLSGHLNLRSDVELILRCVDRAELLGAIKGAALDAIVSVGAPQWLDRQCAQEAAERSLRIVGITDDPFQTDRLGSLGAIVLPTTCTVEEIVDACLSKPSTPVEMAPDYSQVCGELVAVWGPKGAPGRTRVAIEIAFEIAATGAQSILIDGDPYGGDILQLLGILNELPTVVWASRMAAKDELTAELLESEFIHTSPDSPLVLPGLPRADLWAEVSDYGWATLLRLARTSFRFTICDVGFCLEPETSTFAEGGGRNRMARAALSASDHVVAVCRGDAIGIKNFIWSFQQLRDLADVDDVVVLANRVERSDEKQVTQLLRRYCGKRPLCFIPDRPAVYDKALSSGVPVRELAGSAESATAIRTLAAALGAEVESQGLLSRMAARR